MCNQEIRPLTTEEKKGIVEGYKVFLIKGKGKIVSPFQEFSFRKHLWNVAKINSTNSIECEDCGFHVFLYHQDAIDYAKLITDEYFQNEDTLVVHRVKVKDVICIGRIANGYYGSRITTKDSVIQCKKMKLLERVYESC